MNFPEDFLHYIWQFKSFDFKDLCVSSGDTLKIIHQGFLNKNSGPDFTNAKLQLGNTIWAGNVEIHLKSSDWLKHNHQTDASYENVILHVVYENDIDIKRIDGSILPVLELRHRIAKTLIDQYATLFLNLNDFPCSAQIQHVDPLIIDSFLSRVLIERFEEKTLEVFKILTELHGNWDETFYRFIARNFGFKVNALPFELFAKTIPQNLYAKHKNNAMQIEALVFGAAGFLNDNFENPYPSALQQEFQFLQKKYHIKPVETTLWKFMRMRPQNFPTLRLAQFAALIIKQNHLFSKVIELKDISELIGLFENLPVDTFWETHYHFKKKADQVAVQIGKKSIENILLNTVALFLFAYGKHTSTQHYINRAIKLLDCLPAESNSILNRFTEKGIKIGNAFNSQGLLQLKKQYCDQKKCLSCGIGIKILKQA